jgi:hypothetical protein
VYGIVESQDRAVEVAAQLDGVGADVHVVDFDRGGARVQRQIEVP